MLSSAFYAVFLFAGILSVVDAYPGKRRGKKVLFLACISTSYYKSLARSSHLCNQLFADERKRNVEESAINIENQVIPSYLCY